VWTYSGVNIEIGRGISAFFWDFTQQLKKEKGKQNKEEEDRKKVSKLLFFSFMWVFLTGVVLL
jgi:hypothetical protein